MSSVKSARKQPLDDLVLRVCHLELAECKDLAEFREGIAIMARNLEETLAALGCYKPPSSRIRRAAESVKLRAVLLLNLCREIARSINEQTLDKDEPEKWREAA